MGIDEKITLLNSATLESLNEIEQQKIIERFTEVGLKILEADFGFVFWKQPAKKKYRLAYKSPTTPYEPNLPREKGYNSKVENTKAPYMGLVEKEKSKKYDLTPYMKSIVIVPILYKQKQFGNLVLCFKNQRTFSTQDRSLGVALGNAAAQTLTIHSLYADLKDFKNRLDKTLDSVFIFDPYTLKIEYANQGAVNQLGLRESEIKKRTIVDIQTKYDFHDFKNLITPPFLGGPDSLTVETALKTKDGKEMAVELFIQLTRSLDGSKKFLSIVHEIAERKRYEQEITSLLRQKDAFFSIASHELKTPVTTIKGFAQLLSLRLQHSDPDIREFLDKINQHTDKLSNLINDLLDVSRISSGKFQFEHKQFELMSLIQNTTKDLRVIISGHSVVFKPEEQLTFKNEGPYWINGDESRIAQVLTNLVTNAAKYSPRNSEILVGISAENNLVTVSVEDFGMGVPKQVGRKIFQPFYQPKRHSSKTFSGLGLGLHISSIIVRHHKGSIDFRNKKTGAVFYFTLPYSHEPNPV